MDRPFLLKKVSYNAKKSIFEKPFNNNTTDIRYHIVYIQNVAHIITIKAPRNISVLSSKVHPPIMYKPNQRRTALHHAFLHLHKKTRVARNKPHLNHKNYPTSAQVGDFSAQVYKFSVRKIVLYIYIVSRAV